MGNSLYSSFKISHRELVGEFEAVRFRLYYEISLLSFVRKSQLPSYGHEVDSIGNRMVLWKSSDCISHLPGACLHDDVITPHKGHWRGALIFSLICPWINVWVNNREAADLRRHRTHYDATVMEYENKPNRYISLVSKARDWVFIWPYRSKIR